MLEFIETSVEQRAAAKADLQQAVSSLREEIHKVRADLIKWSFVFWAGNLAALTGIMFALLRGAR